MSENPSVTVSDEGVVSGENSITVTAPEPEQNVLQEINVLVEYALRTLVRMLLMMKMTITKSFLEL